ncbi:glycoside hydrolase family 2 protein [Schizophyllum amplum]|uniref:Glycoside hydrolase family 2 protein n=1 Tax=Schizophyllum amplum TaxID=97359 RepID=A0A550BXK2_9AGAR|nr:glycoside hydrolase family 2 protein [Auriculariopsis ampla]
MLPLYFLALAAAARAALLKNGGLTDDRPSYDSPEDATYALVEPKLKTPWTDDVAADPDNVWPQYPRPLLRRDDWISLNGVWEFQFAATNSSDEVANPPVNTTLAQRILVPYCIESGLSGIALQSETHASWYRTSFEVPQSFDQNVTLHFGAVDYETTIFVNGVNVGSHTGGYDKFFFDVTSNIVKGGFNELIVYVYDPTDAISNRPMGKQRVVPSHIFYVPCSGIWQTVSIEAVPSTEYITNIDLRAAADGSVNATISTSNNGSSTPVEITFIDPIDGSQTFFSTSGTANTPFSFKVDPAPATWSPESPTLYNVTVAVGDDVAQTYTGFRTVERATVAGVPRFVLNGNPVFQFGPLDQGYWPDGLHSPPSYEAMVFDLQYLKNLGMNFVRKHIKVEPDLFYAAADSMGMIVMQDMPAMNNVDVSTITDEEQAEFERELDIIVQKHTSFPSILSFVIYNEGWGQIKSTPEIHLTDRVRELVAGHQLINSMSGWNDFAYQVFNISVGDYQDNHHYSSPQCGTPFVSAASVPYDGLRIGFQGEFGGVGHNVSIEHLWNDQEAIRAINETYEVDKTLEAWNYRALRVIEELREQTELFDCNGGVYTQTTDVEGEVNGFLTYDRAVSRVDEAEWKAAIAALYETFAAKVSGTQYL